MSQCRNSTKPDHVISMCNLYSITTNQAAIINLFRVVKRYVSNLAPPPGVFPDYPAPVPAQAGHRSPTFQGGAVTPLQRAKGRSA